MPNSDRKRLDLSSTKKVKAKALTEQVEQKKVVTEQVVEETPVYEYVRPEESEKDAVDNKVEHLVSHLEESPSVKKVERKKLDLSSKKFNKKETSECVKEEEVKPTQVVREQVEVVKEEVLDPTPGTPDSILGTIDKQLSTMAKLTKMDAPATKRSLNKRSKTWKVRFEMRRMVLEMSGMQAQNTIVGGLGAGSPGSGEVNLLKLDDVQGQVLISK